MQHCFLLSRKSLRFLGSAMDIAIEHRKNRCDFGALSFTATTKDFGSKKRFQRGWCTNCQNLREQQHVYHPQDYTGYVHLGFCGGGARIVGFENGFATQTRGRELNTNFFFSSFSGAPGISRQNPGISRQLRAPSPGLFLSQRLPNEVQFSVV